MIEENAELKGENRGGKGKGKGGLGARGLYTVYSIK